MKEEFILDALNELIETCQDSERHFLLCAHQTSTDEFKACFLERAKRSQKATIELQAFVAAYGVKEQVPGSAIGTLKRAWLRLRSALTPPSEQAWLKVCNETEVRLLARYRRIMYSSMLPASVHNTLARHFHAWQRVHHEMRSLRSMLNVSM